MKRILSIKRTALTGLIALILGVAPTPSVSAAELALSDGPLFIELGVAPNVVVTLDDSGSMTRCAVTDKGLDKDALVDRDGDYGPLDTAYLGAAAPGLNKLAYDPNIEYVIPLEITGMPVFIPSFTNAPDDAYRAAGYNTGSTSYYDLSSSWRPCRSKTDWYDPFAPPADGPGKPAYYTIFTGSDWTNESQVIDNSNYTIITVGSAADVGGFGTSAAEKQQNFANWFSYYRYRYLTMKTVAARAFAHPDLNNRIRLAYSLMWGETGYCTTTGWPGDCNGSSSGLRSTDSSTPGEGGYSNRAGPISLLKQYEGANRAAFFQWIFHSTTEGGTPLLMSTERAGEFYRDKYPVRDTSVTLGDKEIRWEPMDPVDSPWSFDPGVTRDPVFSCRQAFFVLMTDGGWDCDEEASCGVAGNVDNQSWTYPEALPSGATDYTPFAPYKDDNDEFYAGGTWGYLADNAFYYWVNDLQPSVPNDVPTFMPDPTPHPVTNKVEDNPNNDPATWQHMVTFTVGFAVDGSIPQTPANYQALLKGASDGGIDWSSNTIDDLWHAGINGRGKYMNAKSSQELVDSFATALSDVLARSASGSSVALNSGSLDANSRLYQASFQSGSWFGHLLAYDLNATTGAVISPEAWDAGPLLNTQVAGSGWDTAREIITFDGSDGVPFRWANLSASMKSELTASVPGVLQQQGQARSEYLRGSEADEGINGNKYRARTGKLGDIVDSSPVFVGAPKFNYPDGLESQAYASFASSNSGRTGMVYVGANDGMLHGFDAGTGAEKIAYVPRKVFPNLAQLLAPAYAHKFFVDGPPIAGDAFYSGAWHTVLVGGLRKGGQGIYALDVTNPANFDESNASSLVLWEFTDADDADLGYTYSSPAIVRMKNGKWAAVFGNGYNNTEADGAASTTGHAYLYIAFLEDGLDGWSAGDFIKIDTGAGSATTPNGLATPAPVDVDGDRIIDYIYAGDLLGNMWKFDVTSSTASSWSVAYGGSPLYVAKDGSGVIQPITTQPEVGRHPQNTSAGVKNDGGYMVYFGTGKYLEGVDNKVTAVQTQSFYGVWDPNEASLPSGYDRMQLLEQQILREDAVTVNSVTANVRVTSDNTITWAADPLNPGSDDLGWYMDLLNTEGGNTDNQGERQVTTPIVRNGRIIFATMIPSGSSCVFGGDGWIMELDLADGSRLGDPPFDFDGDGTFDLVDDGSGNNVAPSGIQSTGGAPSAPGILDRGDGTEMKYVSGTEGSDIQTIAEQGPSPGSGGGSRESWQQLR